MSGTVAVVGATGAVGGIVLDEIVKQKLPYGKLKLLASERSAGTIIEVAGQPITVELLEPEAFKGVDLVIASTPDEVAAEFVPWAVERGAVVVDESAFYRMNPDVPLVIPEVNAQAASEHKGIIASPNCSTTQMVVALHPLRNAAGLRQIIVSTYQAVSGAGLAANTETIENTHKVLKGQTGQVSVFQHDIAMNLIPQIGSHKEAGFTSEEVKMVRETHKIFGDDTIAINATCVRVPVLVGHSESIYCETEQPLELDEIKRLFSEADGVTLIDDLDNQEYPMPRPCADKPDVFVGRVRKDLHHECGISFWCVSDNLRKGAATNAVQIGKLLSESVAANLSLPNN
ncbi:MAG TPA: aspartate-semialdehyde dehydrogenase [Planctomycetaceae bacterium]|nr:aspartate-semialdehyde dehydrogenase [Planctomycetaceae bacterium]